MLLLDPWTLPGDIDTMTCVASWSFGLLAVTAAAEVVEKGGSSLDAIEKGVNGKILKLFPAPYLNSTTHGTSPEYQCKGYRLHTV